MKPKKKLLPQRHAIGDNCTNRTFQLQLPNARNNVCIWLARMTGIVSTYTFPFFVGFSTSKTFLVFYLCPFHFLGRAGFSPACPFPSSFLCSCTSTIVVGSCPSLGPTSFLCRCPFHSTVRILCLMHSTLLDFAPAPAGDLTFFLQHHLFNLFFRQGFLILVRLYIFWGSHVLFFPLPLPLPLPF